jgi:protoporphyrinogen oxidase
VNREEVFPCQWVYFTEKVFNRVSEITKFSPAVVPPGKTALSVELGCNRGDPLYAASDEEVYRRVVADLESLQVLKRSEIDDCLILRHPDAYPLYLIGYRESLAAVLDHFAADPCLHIGGRQGLFRYVNMDQAMEMGFGIAEKIRGKQEG